MQPMRLHIIRPQLEVSPEFVPQDGMFRQLKNGLNLFCLLIIFIMIADLKFI